ncbi:MAG: hypothetical protein OEV94_11580 [Deltaproteobacteria bacterium]|nr:hypothetical protein [Deltaproteobacteria bacterium]
MMNQKEIKRFRVLFIAAALWNLTGAVFGYFNTSHTFSVIFGRELTDPLYFAIYQGAWGTTLMYFLGYLIVAYNPVRHSGIVLIGGIGKVGYAVKLLQLYMAGIASSAALIVIIGDFTFAFLFCWYFYRLIKLRTPQQTLL